MIIDEIREKTKDIPGVIVEVTKPHGGPPTGKPITLQIARSIPTCLFPAARKAADIVRAQPRHARRRRRPAAPRHRLEARRRQGRGREVRRQPRHGRHRRAARHQRRQGVRIPARHRPTSRSTSWCASPRSGAASTRSTSSTVNTPVRHRADRQFRRRARPTPKVGLINRVDGLARRHRHRQRGRGRAVGGRPAGRSWPSSPRRRSRRRRHLQA